MMDKKREGITKVITIHPKGGMFVPHVMAIHPIYVEPFQSEQSGGLTDQLTRNQN